MNKKEVAACPPEDAAVIPREIAESDDRNAVKEWLEAHNKNGAFAAEQGTTVLRLGRGSCDMVKSFYIPNSVTEIGGSAFFYCRALTSVNIPDSVTKIGRWAFQGCVSLTSLTIPASVTEIGAGAFSYVSNIILSDGITRLSDYMFSDSLITSITIPESVTEIEVHAFDPCHDLTAVRIPGLVSEISYTAFEHCESLKTVYLPSGCKIDGLGYFRYCGAEVIRY